MPTVKSYFVRAQTSVVNELRRWIQTVDTLESRKLKKLSLAKEIFESAKSFIIFIFKKFQSNPNKIAKVVSQFVLYCILKENFKIS